MSDSEYYAQIKTTAQFVFEKYLLPRNLDEFQAVDKNDGELCVCPCIDANCMGVSLDSRTFSASSIALDIAIIRYLLKNEGIPQSILDRNFAKMDSLAIKSLNDPRPKSAEVIETLDDKRLYQFAALAQKLCSELNSYEKRSRNVFKYSIAECGSGGYDVTIETKPAGGTCRYIPIFDYKLCQALKINPKDTNTCDGWLTAASLEEDMVGEYYVVVTWPTGAPKEGIYNVSKSKTIVIFQ